MSVDVSQVKGLLYVDGTADNDLIQSYISAAQNFIKNAVGNDVAGFWEDKSVVSLYDLAVKSLAATYYEYRLSLSDTQTFQNDLTVNAIIGQLRGLYASAEGGDDNENADESSASHSASRGAEDSSDEHSTGEQG